MTDDLEARLADAEAEIARLRGWQREVCDIYGYDSDDPGNADEVLTCLPAWKGEADGESERLREVESALADAENALRTLRERVAGLADQWVRMGILRSMEGTVSAKRGRELRAALAEAAPALPSSQTSEAGCSDAPAEASPPAEPVDATYALDDDPRAPWNQP